MVKVYMLSPRCLVEHRSLSFQVQVFFLHGCKENLWGWPQPMTPPQTSPDCRQFLETAKAIKKLLLRVGISIFSTIWGCLNM